MIKGQTPGQERPEGRGWREQVWRLGNSTAADPSIGSVQDRPVRIQGTRVPRMGPQQYGSRGPKGRQGPGVHQLMSGHTHVRPHAEHHAATRSRDALPHATHRRTLATRAQ